MQGIVIGGNIRCFLKLAGTEYMPDFRDKILLDKVAGILLGTFTEMEKENCKPDIVTLLQNYIKADLPVVVTKEIGHGVDSKAIFIGKELKLDI